jgi:predicted TIM-barrel fold metal-dependent hydrolase
MTADMLSGAVDYWCNAFTPDRQAVWQQAIDNQGLTLKVYRDGDEFSEPDAMVRRLDATGFSTVILPVSDHDDGSELDSFEHVAVRVTEITDLNKRFPARFVGQWSVNPDKGAAGVATAERMLGESWCMGLHNHTQSWDRPFDHPDFNPYYELCATYDVPFVMQAGASGGNFPHECGHPSGIAPPASEFAEVRFVLSHTGAPWASETIEMVRRFDNVFLGTATWPPRRWSDDLVAFISGEGQHKVLYGSGFPTSGHTQAVRQFARSSLDADTKHALTSTNARIVFTRLPEESS